MRADGTSSRRAFLEREQIDIAGIEFIEDAEGQIWTYDINGTTNYSPEVEDRHDLGGMAAVADLLKRELEAAATGEHVPP